MFLFLFSALCCKRHLDFSLLDKLDKRLEEDFLLSLQVNKAPEGQKKEAGTNAEEKRLRQSLFLQTWRIFKKCCPPKYTAL